MKNIKIQSVLVIQTAFPGDVVLTLPLVQILKKTLPGAVIDIVVIPRCAELIANHPSINGVIVYDKKSSESGLGSFLKKVRDIKSNKYDCAFIPHRSLRSALLARLAGIKIRIGFDKSTGYFLFTHKISYAKNINEIERNCSLLKALEIGPSVKEYPRLFPSFHDKKKIGHFLSENGIQHVHNLIGVAPGTVWKTKQWLPERFIELVNKLTTDGLHVVLIGGREDVELCEIIRKECRHGLVVSAAGKTTFLQSAELIKRCRVLVSNDSAPMHLAGAMRTRIVSIFGATIPEYGFAPYGESDIVIETKGLTCRPCSKHGGNKCPVKTFDCMKKITAEMVYDKVIELLGYSSG